MASPRTRTDRNRKRRSSKSRILRAACRHPTYIIQQDVPVPNSRIITFAAIVIAALVASPVLASAQDATQSGSKVAHFTLPNGLDLVVSPDRRAPIVTHMVWYRVGAADEEAGKSGLAHFLEHLMFKGTKKNPINYFSQFVAGVGGQENAFTSSDYTAYYQRVPREHLAKTMELEA